MGSHTSSSQRRRDRPASHDARVQLEGWFTWLTTLLPVADAASRGRPAMPIGAIAWLALAATPAMTQTKPFTIQDYLPLAVGNSWTFLHMYKDERSQGSAEHTYHGSGHFPDWDASNRRLTISILHTEIHDGNTYHVFSGVPSSNWPPAPGLSPTGMELLAGMKLRWSGDSIMMWDNGGEVEFFRFAPMLPESASVQFDEGVYNVSVDGTSCTVNTLRYSSPDQRVPAIKFTFLGEEGDLSGCRFIAGYGVDSCDSSSGRMEFDISESLLENTLWGLRANLLVADSSCPDAGNGGGESASDCQSTGTFEVIDRSELWYGYREETSISHSTWGSMKSQVMRILFQEPRRSASWSITP